MDELTQAVIEYQEGRLGLESVQGKVALFLFEHLNARSKIDEDFVSDFIVFFYPKMQGLFLRFKNRGLPFRHYLLKTTKWQMKTFRIQRSHAKRMQCLAIEQEEKTFAENIFEELELPVTMEPTEAWRELLERAAKKDPVLKKRIALLILKSALSIQEWQLEELCRLSEIDLAWIQSCLRDIRALLEPKTERVRNLSEKQSSLYIKKVHAQNEICYESSPSIRGLWAEREKAVSKKISNLQREMKSIPMGPSNHDLAKILRMPKGSVDSGLYHLKNLLKKEYIHVHDDTSGDS